MTVLDTAVTAGKWLAWVGLVCGVLYAVGGFFVDLFTTGLNRGTALAFMAVPGMPVVFGLAGFLLGGLGAVVVDGFLALRAWVSR